LALLLAPAARGETIAVEVSKLAFAPAEISAHVGDTIVWTNKDFVVHSATARNRDWDVMLPAHGSGKVELKKPGKVDYFCRFHPNMKGAISVEPK
jgi:plastocyanin